MSGCTITIGIFTTQYFFRLLKQKQKKATQELASILALAPPVCDPSQCRVCRTLATLQQTSELVLPRVRKLEVPGNKASMNLSGYLTCWRGRGLGAAALPGGGSASGHLPPFLASGAALTLQGCPGRASGRTGMTPSIITPDVSNLSQCG